MALAYRRESLCWPLLLKMKSSVSVVWLQKKLLCWLWFALMIQRSMKM